MAVHSRDVLFSLSRNCSLTLAGGNEFVRLVRKSSVQISESGAYDGLQVSRNLLFGVWNAIDAWNVPASCAGLICSRYEVELRIGAST